MTSEKKKYDNKTIARLINNLWSTLTEDERSEIHGILRT